MGGMPGDQLLSSNSVQDSDFYSQTTSFSPVGSRLVLMRCKLLCGVCNTARVISETGTGAVVRRSNLIHMQTVAGPNVM